MTNPKGKDSRRDTRPIEIRKDLYRILDKEYSETKPLMINFTSFINHKLELIVKKAALLRKQFPNLTLVSADPNVGFFIKDSKLDEVIEVKIDQNFICNSQCRHHKTNTCEHVQYALLTPATNDMLPYSLIGTGEDHGEKDESEENMVRYR